MKGLLIKDLYSLADQAKIFLLLIVFFSVMGDPMNLFAVVYAAILPISAMAFDERSRWDTLAAMMPYSVRDLVLSKYVLCYIGVVIASILSVAAQYIISIFKHTSLNADIFFTVIFVACIAVILLAINLPFMFKLGVEKGRMVYILFTVLIIAFGMGGGTALVAIMTELRLPLSGLLAAALSLTVVINVLSVLLSQKIYKQKTV